MNSIRHFFSLALLVWASAAFAQSTGGIRGRVTNRNGGAVEAVSVGLQGLPQGDITDDQGRFMIRPVAPGTYTLVVSAVGLKTEQQSVTVTAGQTATVNFSLAESAAELKEVVVSGNRTNKFSRTNSDDVAKMPLKNVENPQVYNTVTKELLTEQLVFTADDATRNVPGLQRMWEATGRAGDGGSYYAMRGFIVQTQLRNGLVGNVTNTIDAVNLEKLEVIKGPSGTLYGSSLTSYGGLLNRVTKRAYDHFGGELSYAGGSYNFNRVALDLNTPLNSAKTILFRVNGAWNYEKSFQTAGFSRTYAVAPSLTIRPSEKLSITLDGELQTGTGTTKQTFFPQGTATTLGASRADELPLDYRQAYTGDGLWAKSRSVNLFGQVNYQLSPAWRSSTNYTYSSSYSDGGGVYFYLRGNRRGLASQDSLERRSQNTSDSRANLTEVQQLFNGDFLLGNLRNRVVVGLDFLHLRNSQLFLDYGFDVVPIRAGYNYSNFTGAALEAANAGTSAYPYLVDNERNTYSAFVSDVLNITDRLNILAAVRIDRFANKGGTYFGPEASYNQTAYSPKFGAVYQLVPEQLSVFANYQNSFRNPGFYTTATAANPTQPISVNAKLEQANQVEAGVKFDRLGGRFTATLSLYNIYVKNLLRYDPTIGSFYAQTQNGEQLSRGVEVDIIANPAKGLNVVGGFSYNYSELAVSTADEQGRRPNTASSPVLANLWVSYRLSEGPLRGLGLGAGGNYASDNRIQNTTSSVFILPAYTVLNASAFYDQPRYRLSVKADNLTNTHYWIGYTTINPQKLRSIIGQVALKF
ncbi:TonB-dependent receptor [Hymenobacter sp. RP-2-7]|uniref:TonB-dependent receptor n=1 Tax=Hymenobacter polaris TaxID=2682546 RepID=A0A7Y0AFQ7_9BACT|nr:TonB-dependent receptor [Hymenobacter polaris]NML66535.1 TonB-dependent receptor [Hymenobacter polaris]